MRSALRPGVLLMLAMATAATADDDPALQAKKVTDPEKALTFVGFYRINSGENSGEVIPTEQLQSNVVRITEDMIVVLDKQETRLYACTYTLDDDHEPARLDMEATGGPPEARGQTAKGIIRRESRDDREMVLLCYRVVGEQYPEDFTTSTGAEELLFVLESIPDPETTPAEPLPKEERRPDGSD